MSNASFYDYSDAEVITVPACRARDAEPRPTPPTMEERNATLPPLHDTFRFVKEADGEWVVEHRGGGNSTHTNRVVVIERRDGSSAVLRLGNRYDVRRSGARPVPHYFIRESYESIEEAVECGATVWPKICHEAAEAVLAQSSQPPRGRMVLF